VDVSQKPRLSEEGLLPFDRASAAISFAAMAAVFISGPASGENGANGER
jgi:hypothetical protein